MIIDAEPEINENDRTLKVKKNIDTNEETVIMLNGLIGFTDEDFDIQDDTITLKEDFDIEYGIDTLWVMYTEAP